MADKHEVNDIARALSGRYTLVTDGLSSREADLVVSAVNTLAKGVGNSERPDAIVTVDGITLGIEHFKLYPETSRKGDKLEIYLRETTHFDKTKVGLQVGPSRHYDEKCTTISNSVNEHRLRYSDSQELLSRLCTEFDKVYSEHASSIPEYIKKLGCGRHKLVFLVECCNFKIKLDKNTDLSPYWLNEIRGIIRKADIKPDYIAFFNNSYEPPVLCVSDIAIPDDLISCYSINDAEIMLLGTLPWICRCEENDANDGAR